MRGYPPACGFERVEVPGELERRIRKEAEGIIHIPEKTWKDILALSDKMDCR